MPKISPIISEDYNRQENVQNAPTQVSYSDDNTEVSLSKLQKVKNALFDGLLITTWHGIPKIITSKNRFNLSFWMILTTLAFGGCVYFILTSVQEYEEYETIAQTKYHKMSSLTFPAVYICPLKSTTLEKLIFLCQFDDAEVNCRDHMKLVEIKNNLGKARNCFVFNSGNNYTGHRVKILNTTKIGFTYAFRIYAYLENNNFINYYIGYNNIKPDLDEVYRFYDGGFTANIVLQKIVSKQLMTPKFLCRDDSIKDDYRQIECSTKCFHQLASKKCNCVFKSGDINDCFINPAKTCVHDFNDEFLRTNTNECSVQCPQECDSIRYSITPQSIRYNPDTNRLGWWRQKVVERYNRTDSDEILIASALSLYVLYEDLTYTEIFQVIKTSPPDLVSNIGGTMGLFLGTSLLSLTEIVELVVQVLAALFD